MKKFLFFYSETKFKVYSKDSVSNDEIEKMRKKGFNYEEIEADNEQEVFYKVREMNEINVKSLKEYGGDITFSAIIESLLR